jgi:hypothetical protein
MRTAFAIFIFAICALSAQYSVRQPAYVALLNTRGSSAGGGGGTAMPTNGLVIHYAARLVSGTNDGERMYSMPDFSINKYHGVQTAAGFGPLYKVNQINGLPAFQFDSAQYINMSNVFSGLTSATIKIVVKTKNDPSSSAADSGLWSITTAAQTGHFPYTDGVIYETAGTDTRKTVGDPATTLAQWNLYATVTKSAGYTNKLNTTVIFSTGANTVGFSTAPKLGTSSAGVFDFGGYVAELLIWDHELSATEEAESNAALDEFYALPY